MDWFIAMVDDGVTFEAGEDCLVKLRFVCDDVFACLDFGDVFVEGSFVCRCAKRHGLVDRDGNMAEFVVEVSDEFLEGAGVKGEGHVQVLGL